MINFAKRTAVSAALLIPVFAYARGGYCDRQCLRGRPYIAAIIIFALICVVTPFIYRGLKRGISIMYWFMRDFLSAVKKLFTHL